jgi:hypothetical protein
MTLVLFPPLSKETPDAEGVLATWFVSEGSTVAPDQLLFPASSSVPVPFLIREPGVTARVDGLT